MKAKVLALGLSAALVGESAIAQDANHLYIQAAKNACQEKGVNNSFLATTTDRLENTLYLYDENKTVTITSWYQYHDLKMAIPRQIVRIIEGNSVKVSVVEFEKQSTASTTTPTQVYAVDDDRTETFANYQSLLKALDEDLALQKRVVACPKKTPDQAIAQLNTDRTNAIKVPAWTEEQANTPWVPPTQSPPQPLSTTAQSSGAPN